MRIIWGKNVPDEAASKYTNLEAWEHARRLICLYKVGKG